MYFKIGLRELPFEIYPRQIIYVENEYDEEVNAYIQKNYEAITKHFEEKGWEFIYFPKLAEQVKKSELLKYNTPYADGFKEDFKIGSSILLDYMMRPENRKNIKPGLIFGNPFILNCGDEDNPHLVCGVELTKNRYYITDNLSNFLKDIEYHYFDIPRISYHKSIDQNVDPSDDDGVLFRDGDDDDSDILFRDGDEEEEFEDDVLMMMDEVRDIVEKLKLKGVSEFVLEKLIHGEEKLSRLHITKDYRIILPDYGNMEIEMKPLPKILFLLFIKHPEGIFFKHLIDYRDELLSLYKEVKGGLFSASEAQKSIERMTDPLDNSVNEKCSNVKAAFVSKFDERLAKNYYIIGGRNQLRKIALPRELVIWE